ncbi:hypothetical protein BASA61_007715 [Batrachochytrium salamandrivorans]|nr:hypothetical protein BASA60_009526 [Batrachochytrium salamandrivorans]KAH6584067.1 hypothetical protein BASA61_007715 [Batrachochytrium salamandrivorans]
MTQVIAYLKSYATVRASIPPSSLDEMRGEDTCGNPRPLLPHIQSLSSGPTSLSPEDTDRDNEPELSHSKDSPIPTDLVFLNIDCSVGSITYDGIDVCGERAVTSIMSTLNRLKGTIDRISFIGYSLGGLICRYAIGRLMSANVFMNVRPINFITLATPHLGTAKPVTSFVGRGFNFIMRSALVRVGRQLTLKDEFLNGTPLLLVLSNPDMCFHKALALFQNRATFANSRNDRTVRYTTAAIMSTNPFTRFKEIKLDPVEYPNIVFPSKTEPWEKEPWEWSQISIVCLFAIFSPILIPLWLLVLSFVLTAMSIQARIRNTPAVTDICWISPGSAPPSPTSLSGMEIATSTAGEGKNSETNTNALRLIPDTAHPIAKSDPKKQRECMISSLNSLEWRRVNVSIHFTNAHAAIILRRGGSGNANILIYLAKEVFISE